MFPNISHRGFAVVADPSERRNDHVELGFDISDYRASRGGFRLRRVSGRGGMDRQDPVRRVSRAVPGELADGGRTAAACGLAGPGARVRYRTEQLSPSRRATGGGAVEKYPVRFTAIKGVHAMVNQQTLQGNWNEIKGKLRSKWGQLTNDDLQTAHGNVDQLIGLIQRKTGEARSSIE